MIEKNPQIFLLHRNSNSFFPDFVLTLSPFLTSHPVHLKYNNFKWQSCLPGNCFFYVIWIIIVIVISDHLKTHWTFKFQILKKLYHVFYGWEEEIDLYHLLWYHILYLFLWGICVTSIKIHYGLEEMPT